MIFPQDPWERLRHRPASDRNGGRHRLGIGALSTLTKRGLSIPEDISLVGYNDIPIVSRLPVPLTTVRVPFDQIAAAALDLLAETATPGTERIRVATPTLIPRRSTAALRDIGPR